jgi:HD-GYP domain-containing protein (c-di-GMP phosphodiesterase class II)
MREVAGKHLDPKYVELLIENMEKALAINERFPNLLAALVAREAQVVVQAHAG